MKKIITNGEAARVFTLLLLAICASVGGAASAAEPAPYPTKPIRWIVGYSPGGSVDVITRAVAHEVGAFLKTSVIVENRPGATGGLASGAMVLVGPSTAPTKDFKQLIHAIKANPDKYAYATGGIGTSQHLAGELINQLAGVKMSHVPYKGGGQAVADVVGGQVPLAVLGTAPVTPHITSGRLRAYGVSTATRVESLPDVPTLAEAGIPNFEATQWFLVAAPMGVAAERLARLNTAISQALTNAAVKDVLLANGMNALALTSTQTVAYSQAEQKKWQDLAKASKLELE